MIRTESAHSRALRSVPVVDSRDDSIAIAVDEALRAGLVSHALPNADRAGLRLEGYERFDALILPEHLESTEAPHSAETAHQISFEEIGGGT